MNAASGDGPFANPPPPTHTHTRTQTPSQWDQQKEIFEESGGGLMRRGLAGGRLCLCVYVCVCMSVSEMLATWVSAELCLERGGLWVCLGGTREAGKSLFKRAATGQTEPEWVCSEWLSRLACMTWGAKLTRLLLKRNGLLVAKAA